ncbi:MAG: heptosyltransferase [Planctomyces sp.]|nr:heptosyltransferase [Planctomyces sp.]
MRVLPADFWDRSPPRRLLIIKPSALGDVVQALPLAVAAKERWPNVKLSWVIAEGLRSLLGLVPQIDEVYSFRRGAGMIPFARLCRELRAARFDTVLDLQGLLRTGAMTFATGAKTRLGLQTSREGSSLACHAVIGGTSRDVPAHARYWKIARDWGIADRPTSPALVPADHDLTLADGLLAGLPRPWIGIQPGTRWVTKSWPVESFAGVAQRLADVTGGGLIFLGAPNETHLTSECQTRVRAVRPDKPVLDLGGKSNLRQLTALLSRLDLLICNDSGPMHLAAEMGTPVVAVFTCTDPLRSGPPGDRHRLVATTLPCRAGYHKNCPMKGTQHLACFRDVTIDRVWHAALEILDQRKG